MIPTPKSRQISSSMDKKPAMQDDQLGPSALSRLPDEIIQQILSLADPSSFASLVLVNSQWRRASQQAYLYAHQLSQCPSYSASHDIPSAHLKEDSLPKLRRRFAREVKRNMFEAYLRPKQTRIKLVSNSISSSSAPGGEGMQFSPSPRGHHLLAYNSSRIYVLDLRGPELEVTRELKILRRPASACIKDDGTLLAVLSTDMQVDLYNLEETPPRRTQSLLLDHAPRTIAMSPCGSVLAAAYEGGIEVSSLHPGALPTDKRAVKCDAVDSLAFSCDGTQLLGTTINSQLPNTVVLTAPYYDPCNHRTGDNISAVWTTSIFFPSTSRDCSHAVLLQESSSDEAAWTFTYDRSFETFRAVRIDDLRNGTTYFTGPIPNPTSQTTLLPCTLPAASECGELVSAGFEGQDIWLYAVPEDLDAVPDVAANSDSGAPTALGRRNSDHRDSVRSPPRAHELEGGRVPQWQSLCDKSRNSFVGGRKVTELRGVNMVKWVSGHGNSLQERLVVTARGVLPPRPITDEDGIDFIDGGRVTLLDFDYGLENGDEQELTIEVGSKEPEVLEEEHRDMATEVAIVRRRTVAQQRSNRSAVMRAATTTTTTPAAAIRSPPVLPTQEETLEDPLIPRQSTTAGIPAHPAVPNDDDASDEEEQQEALDAPYSQANPRSVTTLRRAATAAANTRRLYPSAALAGQVVYRRADGRAEHPHESDADNWVPPPPPYVKDDPQDLPAFLRHAAAPIPGVVEPQRPQINSQPLNDSSSTRPDLPRIRTGPIRYATETSQVTQGSPVHRHPHNRAASDPNSVTSGRLHNQEVPRPMSSPSFSPEQSFSTTRVADSNPISPPSLSSQLPSSRPMHSVEFHPSNRNSFPSPRLPTAHTASHALPGHRHSAAADYAPPVPPKDPPRAQPKVQLRAQPSASKSSQRPVGRGLALDLDIPSPTIINPDWSHYQAEANSAVRRVSNAQTWPRAPQQPELATTAARASHPSSAPAKNTGNTLTDELPPAPRPDQLARLNSRQNQPLPRRASGVLHGAQAHTGDPQRSQRRVASMPLRAADFQPTDMEPEQPLIISTPKGVTGALDAPVQSGSNRSGGEPVILAPVPRHPRPTLVETNSGSLRPAVDRLHTIYSTTSHGDPVQQHAMVHPELANGPPSQPLTASSLRRHTSMTRTPSRARRSAARNILDAKVRGWTGRRKKDKKQESEGGNSSAAWTDVTQGKTGGKDKCIVM